MRYQGFRNIKSPVFDGDAYVRVAAFLNAFGSHNKREAERLKFVKIREAISRPKKKKRRIVGIT